MTHRAPAGSVNTPGQGSARECFKGRSRMTLHGVDFVPQDL